MSSQRDNNYVQTYIPPDVLLRLKAGAFENLRTHLQERSDQVQNIDLMTVSGFCRNCLAKWLVVEARKVSDSLTGDNTRNSEDLIKIKLALDSMGYDEAAQYVYGMDYPMWKKRHATKATDAQMDKFNESKPLWAIHDEQLLTKRAEMKRNSLDSSHQNINPAMTTTTTLSKQNHLLSNVCCQPMEESEGKNKTRPAQSSGQTDSVNTKPSKTRELSAYRSPDLPADQSVSLGVLTVSDRAFSGKYETGDLSGPAVEQAVADVLSSNNDKVTLAKTIKAIVPDDIEAIRNQLKTWSKTNGSSNDETVDLILTTGGTGFSPRDVTPEATQSVVDMPCPGLVVFCTMETAKIQPLASLSRGTAGLLGQTLIVNLPGNPNGVQEIVPILLPLALHALADMK